MVGLFCTGNAMKELWTAQVHLLTPPNVVGNTKAYANVVCWAEDPEDYSVTIARLLEERGWFVLDVELCRRVEECKVIPEELASQIERAKTQLSSCILGTLHYYPSRPA
jgi:hypothetical protein